MNSESGWTIGLMDVEGLPGNVYLSEVDGSGDGVEVKGQAGGRREGVD